MSANGAGSAGDEGSVTLRGARGLVESWVVLSLGLNWDSDASGVKSPASGSFSHNFCSSAAT